MTEGTTLYCGDNCNHTGPHRYPPGQSPIERAYGVRYAPAMTEPTTAAGRALLAELSESPLPGARYAHEVVRLRLDAIEAEAREDGWRSHPSYLHGFRAGRAAALDEARAAVEDIRPVWLSGPDDKSVNLGQVLAAIDALREGADKS